MIWWYRKGALCDIVLCDIVRFNCEFIVETNATKQHNTICDKKKKSMFFLCKMVNYSGLSASRKQGFPSLQTLIKAV